MRGRLSFAIGALALLTAPAHAVSARPAASGAPVVTITSQPDDPTTATDATFTWEFTNARWPYETCSLDGGAFVDCSSPQSYAGLEPGRHDFTVRVTRRNGLVGEASAQWTIVPALVAPTVTLVDRPPAHTTETTAHVGWTSTNADSTTCSLDGAAPAPCTSPLDLTDLTVGDHSFTVTVSNPVGSDSDTAGWTVDPTPSPSSPCGSSDPPPVTYQHVVWIVMENHAYPDVVDPANAPYTASLADACGLATDFHAETHPSLPNYIAMTSGDTQGITDDDGPAQHPLAAESIFSQTSGDWQALQESMPANCALANSGLYAVRHNPATYYTGIRTECLTNDIPLGATPDVSARFTFVTPNLCNDTHDCSIRTGDTWLASFLPKIFASSEYQSGSTAVFLTWDEDDGGATNHIATLVMARSVPAGTRVSTAFDHYSMLRTTEELLGISTYLGQAATATSMRDPFHL
jgi:hypothetical protein